MKRYHDEWITKLPIAHRGLWGPEVPENSLAAFEAAAAAGYAIELDVRLSADGRLVVCHDPNTGRVADGNLVIAHSQASDLVRQSLGHGQNLPLLEDVFSLVRGRVPLLIEIKKGLRADVAGKTLLALVAGYEGEVAAESFDPRIVAWMRRNAPQIPRVQAAGGLPEPHESRWLRILLRGMPLNFWARPQFIAYDVSYYPDPMLRIWQRLIGVPVILWTVSTPDELAVANKAGCNIIFEQVRPPIP